MRFVDNYAINTRNSSADEIANVNFYDDIVHALQHTIKFTSLMESTCHVHSCQMRLLQLETRA